jgi:hypothetical protein
LNDAKMKALLLRIAKVPKHIASWLLTLFVWRCRELYQIAFFQWRKAMPSKVKCNMGDLLELIDFRVAYTFTRRKLPASIPTERTRLASSPPGADYLARYGLSDEGGDRQFIINSFHQLGWPDPYPKENSYKSSAKQPVDGDDLVYDPVRFSEGTAPYVVYIPRAEMLFKMMRACIGVTEASDLWLNLPAEGTSAAQTKK